MLEDLKNFHSPIPALWPVDHLQARNHVKKSAAVKSALEQGSEGAVTPRVNVRRPRRRRRRRRRRWASQTAPAQLHNRPGSLLGPAATLPTIRIIADIITDMSIKSKHLQVTHIFCSVLRSARPAAEPA